jgi:hypothetical protein
MQGLEKKKNSHRGVINPNNSPIDLIRSIGTRRGSLLDTAVTCLVSPKLMLQPILIAFMTPNVGYWNSNLDLQNWLPIFWSLFIYHPSYLVHYILFIYAILPYWSGTVCIYGPDSDHKLGLSVIFREDLFYTEGLSLDFSFRNWIGSPGNIQWAAHTLSVRW